MFKIGKLALIVFLILCLIMFLFGYSGTFSQYFASVTGIFTSLGEKVQYAYQFLNGFVNPPELIKHDELTFDEDGKPNIENGMVEVYNTVLTGSLTVGGLFEKIINGQIAQENILLIEKGGGFMNLSDIRLYKVTYEDNVYYYASDGGTGTNFTDIYRYRYIGTELAYFWSFTGTEIAVSHGKVDLILPYATVATRTCGGRGGV